MLTFIFNTSCLGIDIAPGVLLLCAEKNGLKIRHSAALNQVL